MSLNCLFFSSSIFFLYSPVMALITCLFLARGALELRRVFRAREASSSTETEHSQGVTTQIQHKKLCFNVKGLNHTNSVSVFLLGLSFHAPAARCTSPAVCSAAPLSSVTQSHKLQSTNQPQPSMTTLQNKD